MSLDREYCRIKVVGIGGAGGNSLQRLTAKEHAHFLSWAFIDSDLKMMNALSIEEKILIGANITRGLSTGGDWSVGQKIVASECEQLAAIVSQVDLLFIIAGLGGGTGSCVAPQLAECATKAGAMVIALTCMPFSFEGTLRRDQAEKSLGLLRKTCHAVIPVPNDMAIQQLESGATVIETFTYCDEWIYQMLEAFSKMLFDQRLVAIDLATLKKALSGRGGKTLCGLSHAEGDNLEHQIIENLLQCPLLHLPQLSQRADSLIIHICGGSDLSMQSASPIIAAVSEKFCSKEHTFLSISIDETITRELSLLVLGSTHIQSINTPPYIARAQSNNLFEYTDAQSPAKRRIKRQEKPLSPFKRVFGVNSSKSNKHLQGELMLEKESDEKGYFKGMESNVYNGVDLDIPTFLRKGIKIKL